ncbi:hypothetical protein Goari_019041 [Gossypium aridum]|uniref:Uncharacterized protein n=1 Tax=Gossypium aridum TaxID=34290 RepID=A0A7J8WSJ1_GOSAI|nr:hypothetical protein [Gossypium aridum]
MFVLSRLMVSSTLFCCGGFIYKTQMEGRHGIDALPGMTVLSACLETVSGAGQGYSRVEEVNTGFTNEVSWERPSSGTQGTWTPSPNESKYGSM